MPKLDSMSREEVIKALMDYASNIDISVLRDTIVNYENSEEWNPESQSETTYGDWHIENMNAEIWAERAAWFLGDSMDCGYSYDSVEDFCDEFFGLFS